MIYDENFYADKIEAIEEARRNIYEDSRKFDLSRLWRNWAIGGLSRSVMSKLGLTEISSDARWNYMLDSYILTVYSDNLGRIWITEDNYGIVSMRLFASDTASFERTISSQYKPLHAA